MRRTHQTAATPFLALLLLSAPLQISAHPYPQQDSQQDAAYRYLMPRQCALRCGYLDMYCCNAGEACYTTNGIAGCTTLGGVAYGIYTTTWTETNTFTSTVTTDWPAEPTHGGGSGGSGAPCVPQSPEQSPCGPICCAGDQYCAWEGQCYAKAAGGGGGGGGGWTSVITTNGVVTTQYSAPYRVTSSTATGTRSSSTPSGTALPVDGGGGTGGNLSPGAIAGIVIGTLAGIGLLMLICFCCIARGLWALICGGKKKKKEHRRERVDVVEERYSRHGSRMPSTHSRRDNHNSWFGGRPSSAGNRNEKSSGKKWLGIAAAAGTLLALLNLRKKKKAAHKPRSSRSDSYYSYSGTSPSSSSSGGRTHNTRHTRTTRHSRR